ncbi:hypothetical protein DSO57_1031688 [Entomophthora muscae]|uniref:Uncharacterized protein n=1 Tax=Entomophthora muscae TaxID=34485 RepID=A0ACC2TBN7_9FUNG|nr:hypothetical protein DSO57_1031688 [Entomophthora muscae]
MTPPLTPQPDCPMETPTAAKTTSTQMFGVLYITLTGMVDIMVPNSGSWSFLGQSHPSYGGHYPLAQLYSVPSQPMPLPMPGFLTLTLGLDAGGLGMERPVEQELEAPEEIILARGCKPYKSPSVGLIKGRPI